MQSWQAPNKPTAPPLKRWATRKRWGTRTLWLIVLSAGVLVYLNSFSGVFLFDDARNIVNRLHIRQLWPLPGALLGDQRPIVAISLAVNYAIGELEVWGYHFFNLAIHLLASLALFGVVRRTLLRPQFQGSCGSGGRGWPRSSDLGTRLPHSNRSPTSEEMGHPSCGSSWDPCAPWLAASVALIWVVHPLQTQSVTYLIQRAESMMGLFYLLTLYCLIRGADSARPGLWYAASIAACALGMGSKPVMVTAPVVMWLFDWVFLARSWRETLRRRWVLYLGLAATWFVLIACGVMRGVLNPDAHRATVGFGIRDITPMEYVLTQPGVILHYLKLALWPHPLCLDYCWPVAEGVQAVILPGTVVLILLLGTLWAFRRRPWLGFLGAWFFLILSPTSSFVPVKDPAFEHRMYLPLAAVVVLVVVGGWRILAGAFDALTLSRAVRRVLGGGLLLGVVVYLGFGTVARNRDYHSRVAMWSNVVGQRPLNARAHLDFGLALFDEGRIDEAVAQYSKALEIDSESAKAHTNLGNALVRQRKLDEALAHHREAARIAPNFTEARNNLGACLLERGELDEAVTHLAAALRLSPDDASAHTNMGNALTHLGKIDQALDHYRTALRVAPDFVRAHLNLGMVLVWQKRYAEAISHLNEAVRIRPNHLSGRYNLGVALEQLGRLDEAIEQYREILRLDPHHSDARQRLTAALAKRGG